MSIPLSPRDEDQVERARHADVLKEVHPHRLNRKVGVILKTCADGDRFFDLFTKEAELVTTQCNGARVHVFGWNGGALRLAVRGMRWRWLGLILFRASQFVFERMGVAAIEAFEDAAAARTMKGINTIALYVHAPCGYAYAQGWDFETVLDKHFRAKENLKLALPNIKVACYVHIHYNDGRDRTYFVSKDDWLKYRADV